MSDYFGYLAQIALGTAPALAPRPATRFDRAAARELAPEPDLIDDDTEAVEQEPRAAEPLPAEPSGIYEPERRAPDRQESIGSGRMPRREEAEQPAAEPATPAARRDTPDPAPERSELGPAVPPADPGPADTVHRAEPMPSRSSRPASPAHPVQPVRRDADPSPDERSSPRFAGPDRPEVRPEPVIAPRAAPFPAETATEGDMEYEIARTPEAGEPIVAAPGIPDRPFDWTGRTPSRRQPPAPPTIQVTIGRVEVRAVQPPATPPPPAPRPPAMTLEDYLAKRDGGSP